MAEILRAHPQVAMGRERYANRYQLQRHMPPELFEKERFCRVWHTEDSHHRSLQPYYEELYARFDDCLVVGDKIPEMALDYEPLLRDFTSPRVIYMLRDVIDVASSYKGRALRAKARPNPHGWPPERGALAAVAEWNTSLRNTLEVRERLDIAVVWYDDLVCDPAVGPRLCRFLGLECVTAFAQRLAVAQREGAALSGARRSLLTAQEAAEALANADRASFERLRALA